MKSERLVFSSAILLIAFSLLLTSCVKIHNEEESILAVKEKFPEVRDYPCDVDRCNTLSDLPRYIQSEFKDKVWYHAFIQTGSGVPIINAECFAVKSDGHVEKIGQYSSIEGNGNVFSPINCSFE